MIRPRSQKALDFDVGTDDEPAGVAAVDRAFAIIDAIAASNGPSSLAQIAASTGFYKSTILRLLGSLEKAGYVLRLRDGQYTLGATAFRLGVSYTRTNPLRQIITPILQELVDSDSESASFHIRQGRKKRICLFRIDSGHATIDRIGAGDLLPVNSGAPGRIILAFEGASGSDLDALRSTCFAVSLGEREPGCAGMAAPVFGMGDILQGAVALSGPIDRFGPAALDYWRPRLLGVASHLSRSLGGHFPKISS